MGFGAGSLVFTGLQIGAEIASGPFRAITPGARLLLVTAQMHFIFLNSKSLSLAKHTALAKLGLMHMIATNLCEWLQVSGTMMMKWRGNKKKKNRNKNKQNRKHFSSRKSRRLFEQLDTFYPSNVARLLEKRIKNELPVFESSESICRFIVIVIITIEYRRKTI